MLADPFELHEPASIAEAVALAKRYCGDVRFLAGGTDVLPGLFRGLHTVRHLIYLGRIPELHVFDPIRGVFGAQTSMAYLERDPVVRQRFVAVSLAAHAAAGPALRTSATLGGNLLVDTRCTFYDQSRFWREANEGCLKADGTECRVVSQGSRCYAVYSGDMAPPLLALGATVDIEGLEGRDSKPLEDLYSPGGDGRLSHALPEGALLVAVRLRDPNLWSSYSKLRARGAPDFPEGSIAIGIHETDGRLDHFRIAVGGIDTRPLVMNEITRPWLGKPMSDEVVEATVESVGRRLHPVANTALLTDYRKHVVTRFLRTDLARYLALRSKELTSSIPAGRVG